MGNLPDQERRVQIQVVGREWQNRRTRERLQRLALARQSLTKRLLTGRGVLQPLLALFVEYSFHSFWRFARSRSMLATPRPVLVK